MCGSKTVWMSELIFILLVVKGWWSEGWLEQERSALLQLRHFFNDDKHLHYWVDDENYSDCCQWEGVECNNTNGRVIKLDLRDTRNRDSAEWHLNASLFTPFQQLESLDLSWNNIAGCVENEGLERLSKLNTLKFLFLDHNYFNNNIFLSLGGLSSLKILSLAGNGLNGSIDIKGLDSLSKLEELDMSFNAIDNLVVPKDYRGLRKLNTLYFGGRATAMIDGSKALQSIGSLPSLKTLYLLFTNLKGTVVSQELHNFTNLEELILVESDLHVSQLLQSIASFTSLKYLSMRGCVLKGALHVQDFHEFKNLEHLVMDRMLVEVDTSFLQIVSESMASLRILSLSYSRLNKNTILDQGLCELVHLQELYIRDNDLRDSLPWCLANMTSLQVLNVASNQLTGNFPPGFCELVLLRELYIDNNDLRVAPTWDHASAPALSYFPPNGSPMGKEETVQFTTKNMSYYYRGRILTSMSGIDLSCNKLTGEIPTQIGYLTRIRALNLSHNNLTGTIPTTFSNLKQIESLDLSYNLLHGKIPPQLIVLNTLAVFRVAYNNLSGKIPDRVAQFSTFEEDSYEGNPFLCGLPLSKSCDDNGLTTATPEAYTENKEGDSLIDMDSFLITFTVSYGIVIIGIIGVLCINPYWRRRWFYLVEVCMTSCYYFVADNLIPRRFYRGWM